MEPKAFSQEISAPTTRPTTMALLKRFFKSLRTSLESRASYFWVQQCSAIFRSRWKQNRNFRKRKNFLNVLAKKCFGISSRTGKVNLLILQNEHFSAHNSFALLLLKKYFFKQQMAVSCQKMISQDIELLNFNGFQKWFDSFARVLAQWGSISCSWHYWSRMIACCVCQKQNSFFYQDIRGIFHPG